MKKVAAAYVPALGRTVYLGRIQPKAVLDAGAYKIIVLQDGRTKVMPKLESHYNQSLDKDPPPAKTDWITKGLASIAQPLGNTQQGDCVIASKGHQVGVWTANEMGSPVLSSDNEALSEYHRICGAGDQGCIISDVLDAMKSGGITFGGTAHKIDGYCAVDNANKLMIQVAVEVFGPSIALGIDLPGSWANAVQANDFTWDDTSDGSVGGHDVPIIDYNDKGVIIATWGFWGTITWKALANKSIITEAWCELSQDWYAKGNLAPNGINATTLAADLALLSGGTIPPIGPTPPPPPPPPPPGGNLLTLAADVAIGTSPVPAGSTMTTTVARAAGAYDMVLTPHGPPAPPGTGVITPADIAALKQALATISTILAENPSMKGK